MTLTSTDSLTRTGELVRRERQVRGWSQQDAVEAGKPTSLPSWRKVETGAEDVSDNTCAAVDRAFGWAVGTTKALREGRIEEPVAAPPSGSAAASGDISELAAMMEGIQRELREQRKLIEELRRGQDE